MREETNIRALAELKPDYLGLIFYPQSKRYVNHLDASLLKDLLVDINITGVFVDEELTIVLQKVNQYGLKAIQLHGSETPEYCQLLREELKKAFNGIELIKAFGINESFDFTVPELYMAEVDYFLFDTKTPAHGGSGVKFNWSTLKNYHLDKPYFLSGGIGLEDLGEVTTINDQRLYAVDLNSRFETSPAVKDIQHISQAINTLREASKFKIN